MWSETAVDAALDEWYRDEDWRALYKEPAEFHQIRDEMRSAINAAAAVDGDAQRNAVLEEAAKVAENTEEWIDDDWTYAYKSAAAIRSLKATGQGNGVER